MNVKKVKTIEPTQNQSMSDRRSRRHQRANKKNKVLIHGLLSMEDIPFRKRNPNLSTQAPVGHMNMQNETI
jgi:hypothetical protein